jgi:Cdc6-like AAA superfamily ATPase
MLEKYRTTSYEQYIRFLDADITLEPKEIVEIPAVWESVINVLDTERDVFLRGPYGSGKTATMTVMERELSEEGRLVSHVFDRGLYERQILVMIARPFLDSKEMNPLRTEDLMVKIKEALDERYRTTKRKSIIIVEDIAENVEIGVRRVINLMDLFSEDGAKSAQFFFTGTADNFAALSFIAPLMRDRVIVLNMPEYTDAEIEKLLRTRFPHIFPFSEDCIGAFARITRNPRDILEIAQLACKIAAENWAGNGSVAIEPEMIEVAAEWRGG